MNKMKIKIRPALWFSALMAAFVSGCQVSVGVAPPPAVVVAEPAPVVEVVPPTYVWDGVEFVGDVNGQFMYFSPGGVWVVCDPVVVERFHGWERYHPDWRMNAIHNEREHRLDRAHAARARVERERTAAPARSPAPERPRPAVENRAAPPGKAPAAVQKKPAAAEKKAAPAPKKEEKKKENQ